MVASTRRDVTAGTILGLALPALGVLAATPLYLLFDTAVVGRLGAGDLAALAIGATVLSTITVQLTFLSYGTTARAARHHGSGRDDAAVYEGLQASYVALFVGAVLATGMALGAPLIAGWFSADAFVVGEAVAWMRIASLAVIPALLVMAGNGWMRGLSDTRSPLWFTLAGVIPMAVLVPVLVARYGLIGSAIANVIGEFIIASCFLVALGRRLARSRGNYRFTGPRWAIIRSQLVLGRDLIARSLGFQVAFLLAAAVAGSLGPAHLAAHQILLQLWNFLSLVLDSVAIAAQALVGAALGAGSIARARRTGWIVLRFSVLGSLVLAGGLAAGWTLIPRIFTTDSDVLGRIGTTWPLLLVLVILGGVVFALDGVLLGAADAAFLRTTTLIAVFGGFIPLVGIAKWLEWGLPGVWMGLIAMLVIRCVAVGWRFRGDAWVDSAVSESQQKSPQNPPAQAES